MDELKKIIDDLMILRQEIDDDLVFSKAIDIYIMQQQEKNKNKRTDEIAKREETKFASLKQINFLKRLGYVGDMSKLTIHEASKLIEEMTKNKKQEEEYL
jgi:hypothetical protein